MAAMVTTMTGRSGLLLAMLLTVGGTARSDEVLFQDDFQGRLAEGWSWVREDPKGWRVTEAGLEMRVQPGNMWGPPNNARNVLARPLPEPAGAELEVSVTVTNQPTEQYEQVNLVWYYDDGHMVKLGQELVNGKLSVVMGREEADKTRTIAIMPIEAHSLRVRFLASGNRVRGQFRPAGAGQWVDVGACDLPAHGPPKASLQVYQGPARIERWARFNEFRVVRRQP
jgi:regulation of enolase protein 1 (concanavalin A-like superfamily)